ncbi:MAG: potassium channel family protein, partial [Planctomycetota bacterium]
LFAVAFLAYAVAAILRVVFTDQRVTYNTIAASLCVYLLLGVLWAAVYSVLELIEPDSFSLPAVDVGLSPSADSPDEFSRHALYYSLVTMTTLGYGDIAPQTPPARMFAAVQAVMGQIYLAVLVARLVGLHIVHAQEKDRDDGS